MRRIPFNLNYLLLFIVMIIWGSNVVVFKVLIEFFPPAILTAIRNVIASALILVFLLYRKAFLRLTRSEWYYTAIAALFGTAGHQFFLAKGLITTSASNGSLILALTPLATAMFALLILKERITLIQVIGIITGLVGVTSVLFFGEQGFSTASIGDFYVFLAMLMLAASFIYIRKVTMTVDPKLTTGFMLFIGGFILLIASFIIEPTGIKTLANGTPLVVALLLFSAIASSAIGQMIYNVCIQKVGTSSTAIFTNLIPFFGLVFSVLFLGETIRFEQVIGFFIIIIGVFLGTGIFNKKTISEKESESKLEQGV